jgi:flagellar protein FlaI
VISMGLLEKAQQKKVIVQKEMTEPNISKTTGPLKKTKLSRQTPNQVESVIKIDVIKEKSELKNLGFLEKARRKKQTISGIYVKDELAKEQRKPYSGFKEKGKGGKEVIDEKTGFGWKGLGTRRIVFDYNVNEYIYEVSEPILNEDEVEKKEELSRLFKMLADVNITSMDKKEKEKYLEETMGKIIKDNNIRFIATAKKPKKEKKQKLSKEEKETQKKEEAKIKKEPKPTKLSKEELLAAEQESRDKIFYHIFREFLGYSKIDIIMNDEGIEDVSCDGYHVPIFIYHRKYNAISTNIKFDNESDLDSFVVRLSQICGKQISIYSPIVDGKLPDGSRLQTTLGKTVTKDSTFTIRKFKENPLTPVDLIKYKSLSLDMAAYFWMAIEKGASILFCGGTASGKTTALNALSLFIPPQNKIVSIEDTREVNLPHQNWIAGTTREGFSASDEKTGKDIDMFDLIRAALRQRPKVVIVGEVRGKEAYSLFQAMATGHTSYATVHASDIHTLIQRLENPPISLPRALLTSLDVIVFQNAIDMGGKTVRRMTSVTEIVKIDPDTNQLIFMEPFRWCSKMDDRFESCGASKILNNIKLQNDWTDKQLDTEFENRKIILDWMAKEDIRDYRDVGRIVADYSKYPEEILKKAREEKKK